MDRRSFFNTMLGSAPVAAATLAMTPPSPPRGVEFLNPMCPKCLCVFDVTAHFPNYETRSASGTEPVAVTCRCGWMGELIFFRRQ